MKPQKIEQKRPLKHQLIHRGYRIIEPMCRAWRWLRRPLSLGVRGLVINGDGEVLLVRHTYVEGWYFPGGGVKRRESIQKGLERELQEEVGVTLTQPPELLGIYSNSIGYRSDHVAVFVVRHFDHAPCLNAEIAEWGFFAPDQLPGEVKGGTRKRLAEFISGEVSSFEW